MTLNNCCIDKCLLCRGQVKLTCSIRCCALTFLFLQVLLKGVYIYTLCGMLGLLQRRALVGFCHVLSMCCARKIHIDMIDRLDKVYQHYLCPMDHNFRKH